MSPLASILTADFLNRLN